MKTFADPLFVAQLATTLFMTGLIWFVQIVHYPLFAAIGEAESVPYARRHATLTGYVVGLPMLVELITSFCTLDRSLRPAFVSSPAAALSAVLVVVIWVVTGLVQVPLHGQLGRERRPDSIRRLVRGNWIRTAAWSARSALLLACVLRGLHPPVL